MNWWSKDGDKGGMHMGDVNAWPTQKMEKI